MHYINNYDSIQSTGNLSLTSHNQYIINRDDASILVQGNLTAYADDYIANYATGDIRVGGDLNATANRLSLIHI